MAPSGPKASCLSRSARKAGSFIAAASEQRLRITETAACEKSILRDIVAVVQDLESVKSQLVEEIR
jgi:hypothetical protein